MRTARLHLVPALLLCLSSPALGSITINANIAAEASDPSGPPDNSSKPITADLLDDVLESVTALSRSSSAFSQFSIAGSALSFDFELTAFDESSLARSGRNEASFTLPTDKNARFVLNGGVGFFGSDSDFDFGLSLVDDLGNTIFSTSDDFFDAEGRLTAGRTYTFSYEAELQTLTAQGDGIAFGNASLLLAPTAVPEPATWLTFAGLFGSVFFLRWRVQRAA